MKTYSAYYENGTPLFEKVSGADVYSKMPPHREVSGDKVGKDGVVIERRGVFINKNNGRKFTLLEDKAS